MLVLLFVLCFTLFIETRIEAFVPELKIFAQNEIEKTLNGKIKISIGEIEGGIFRPIEFSDISLRDANKKPLFSSIEIDSIRTNYRVWDILLRGKTGTISNLIAKDSPIYVNFVSRDKKITCFAQIEGNPENFEFKGHTNLFGKERLDFSGRIEKNSFDIEARPARGLLKASGSFTNNGDLILDLRIDHIRFFGYDIVCDANLKNKISIAQDDPKKSYVEGELETKNLVLNYKPFLNIKGAYRISQNRVAIPNLDIGDSFKIRADVGLKNPHKMDLVLLANNVSIAWISSVLGAAETTSMLSGTLNGKFEVAGNAKSAKLNANIDIRKGTISTLDFDSLYASFKGDLPVIRIEDSRITRESGYFILAGEIDLRKLGKGNLFDDIKLKSDERAIVWDGWGTTKLKDVEEVRMEKKINDDINLDFKKFITDQKVDESIRDNDEVQLEYKLHPHDSLKMMVGQDKDFFGLEHKDKF